MRKILKFCPFALLIFLTSIVTILFSSRYYGFRFIPKNAKAMVIIYLVVLFVLTFASIASMRICTKTRTTSSSVLPFMSVAFSIGLTICVEIPKETVYLLSWLTVACAFILAIIFGKESRIRRMSFSLAIFAIVIVGGASKILNEIEFLNFRQDIIAKKVNSPNSSLEAVIINDKDEKRYVVQVRQSNKDLDTSIGTFKNVTVKNLVAFRSDAPLTIQWIDNNVIKINGKDYKASF